MSHSPAQTMQFAKTFARTLKSGSVISLEGDLGSGKTTFIKGIALGLGARNAGEVKSPTFVLMHIYPTRIPLYHFDLYRLDTPADFQAIGLEDFICDPAAISCIEWGDKAVEMIPAGAYHVKLQIVNGPLRRIRILRSLRKKKSRDKKTFLRK